MKLKIEDGKLIAADVGDYYYAIIRSWNLMKWIKAKRWLEGPASADLLNRMAGIVRLPSNIEHERQRLNRLQDAVDAERLKEDPVPLYPYPVKVPLFTHQMRAANMALLTFGLIERGDAVVSNK